MIQGWKLTMNEGLCIDEWCWGLKGVEGGVCGGGARAERALGCRGGGRAERGVSGLLRKPACAASLAPRPILPTCQPVFNLLRVRALRLCAEWRVVRVGANRRAAAPHMRSAVRCRVMPSSQNVLMI